MPLSIKIEVSGRQSRHYIKAYVNNFNVIHMGFYTFCLIQIIIVETLIHHLYLPIL